MTLKRQLFLASLLMLLIPWAGLQFVLELDQALRQQAADQLATQARRMASVAETQLEDFPAVTGRNQVVYARQANRPLKVDGYGDDWPGYEDGDQPWQTVQEGGHRLAWQAAVHGRYLYLLIRVDRKNPAYFNPGNPEQPHEFLRLYWQDGPVVSQRHVRTAAPGPVTGHMPNTRARQDRRIAGYWESFGDRYQIELRMPDPGIGQRMNLELVWPDPRQPELSHSLGARRQPLSRLAGELPALEDRLADLLATGQQVRVREPAGWLTARAERPLPADGADFEALGPLEILERISLNALRTLVRVYQPKPQPFDPDRHDNGQSSTTGLVQHPDGERFLMVTETMADGRRLFLEQSLDQILALSGNVLGSVIARSSLLIVTLMLGLLGYASWLSWRIARLQRAVNASVDSDGRILGSIPPSRASDELGELNRHFSQMVDRLQGYTDYLESFSRRLSHELKTPVAVIRSSLDNLEHAQTNEERVNYRERARSATDRLSQILQGMSEAARLEQSFDRAEQEPFDLADVLSQAVAAYQTLDQGHRIRYQGPAEGCPMTGSPELVVQLLDKLVDNARDFTPAGGLILVELTTGSEFISLLVFNEGSHLPAALARDIFSPFVSVRENRSEGHLGQGLLIVRLIAEFHGGQVSATNHRHDGSDGVRFEVRLPRPRQP